MDYRYTNEGAITAHMHITLDEMDALIEVLEPIAKDDTHSHRHRASSLLVEIKDARAKTIESAASWLEHLRSKLKGDRT